MKETFFDKHFFHIAVIIVLIVFMGSMTVSYVENRRRESDPAFEGRVVSSAESSVKVVTQGDLGLIYSGPAYLERIIIGNDLANATLQVADSITSAIGATSPFLTMFGDAMQGVYEIGVHLSTGIYTAVSSSLYTIFIYIPK